MPLNKSAGGGSSDHHRRLPPSKESENDEYPSNTLWVGSLSADTADPDVMAVFGEHGALDCTTMHGSRSYAFVYFRLVDDAKTAKDALQGSAIHGNAIKIEFARPPKAAKQIWVGGFKSSIRKEQLEDEFLKFGKIENYKFFQDRNSAIIEYHKLEDAIAAHKNMNGKRLAGEQLRVDFLRYQPPRRDWPDLHDSRNGYIGNRALGPVERSVLPDDLRNFHNSSYLGTKRDMSHGGHRDGHPSNILWIGYPPSVQIDEQMLHNAMILFGEIERVKCFPSRHYSFVEFRSIDEAKRAKEGLQGRLFNDPRIQILFSSSDFAPNKDTPPPFPGFRAHRPEILLDESPFGPLDLLGPGHARAPNKFPGSLDTSVMPGPNMLMRPFGSQGLDPRNAGSDFHNLGSIPQNFSDEAGKTVPPSWRRRSPSAPGILPSPPGTLQAVLPITDEWDGFDMRDAKRLRVDTSPTNDGFLRARRADGSSIGEHPFAFSHPEHSVSIRSQLGMRSFDKDYCWRGVIAKGGTHVCYARCVPIGKGIDTPLPDTVNCSARTGLDMLTKHYDEAVGFDIVFFLPDSEEDFASYTDFLRYLGLRNRAGVAKLEDGTTLFLVPPSDFLAKVLKVNGPERLYGVVLKLPQHSTSAVVQQPQLAIAPTLSRRNDQPEAPNLQKNYNFFSQNEDQALRVDYNQSLHEEAARHVGAGKLLSHADEQRATQSAALDQESNASASSQLRVSLTPDLIASLASLIPSNIQSSATGAVQLPSSSIMRLPASSYASVTHDGYMPFQGWRQEYQTNVSVTSMEQQSLPPPLGQDFSNQTPTISQFPPYTNTSSGTDPSLQPLIGGGVPINMPQSAAVSTRPLTSYATSQGGQFSATQSNQPYQFEAPFTSHDNYGNSQTSNAADAFNPVVQQQLRFGSSSAHDLIGTMPQTQLAMSAPIDRGNTDLPAQVQQLQNVLSGSGQEISPGDADKNQRYQSTLQFAASLLLQIQQQQQASARTHGSGNQQ